MASEAPLNTNVTKNYGHSLVVTHGRTNEITGNLVIGGGRGEGAGGGTPPARGPGAGLPGTFLTITDRPLSRISFKIWLAEQFFRLISGLAEFTRKQ